MKTANIAVKPAIGSSIYHLYKELEGRNVTDSRYEEMTLKLRPNDRNDKNVNSQLASIQQATKWLIILGQTVGLMPVLGVLRKPPAALRFKLLSLKMMYGVVIFICQAMIAIITFFRMFQTNVSVTSVGHLSFYVSSAVTTILFFQVAKKWPSLIRKIPHYRLEDYIDPKLRTKCNVSIIIFLAVAVVEHVLSEFTGIAFVLDCVADSTQLYKEYIALSFPWVFELGLPDHFLMGLFVQFINITATLAWSYSDIFIICISYFLASILEGINRKLIDYRNKYSSSNYWVSVREDFRNAAQLVRCFDDVISGVLFTSFANNLFFICFQLYNLLSPLGGYENLTYLIFSMVFVLFRYLCVSLIAARVHTTSQSLAPVLYGVPSNSYNIEVQRFLDQVHHDTVALSGLNFFYVTKSLVLTVAGTIFTYELVLLQYGG